MKTITTVQGKMVAVDTSGAFFMVICRGRNGSAPRFIATDIPVYPVNVVGGIEFVTVPSR